MPLLSASSYCLSCEAFVKVLEMDGRYFSCSMGYKFLGRSNNRASLGRQIFCASGKAYGKSCSSILWFSLLVTSGGNGISPIVLKKLQFLHVHSKPYSKLHMLRRVEYGSAGSKYGITIYGRFLSAPILYIWEATNLIVGFNIRYCYDWHTYAFRVQRVGYRSIWDARMVQ